MSDLEDLKTRFEDADAEAARLSNEYDEKRAQLKNEYQDRLRDANQQAADAQKQYADVIAAQALKDDPDGERIAESLGLSLED